MLGEKEIVGFERDSLHRETQRIQGNGITQTSAYDGNGRLQSLKWGRIERGYRYDDAGQIEEIQDSRCGTLRYQYDPLGRLTSAITPKEAEFFNFDPAGNLLAVKDKADVASSGHGTRPPTSPLLDNLLRRFQAGQEEQQRHYDRQGQLIRIQKPGQPLEEFQWDALGRLRGYTRDDARTEYHYDPLGRRIAKNTTATVFVDPRRGSNHAVAETRRLNQERGYGLTIFGWDGDTLVYERNQKEELRTLYAPGNFSPMVRTRKGQGQTKTETQWMQCDHLGTPMEITDQDGKIVWQADYKAFGLAKIDQSSTAKNHIRFPGQYYDEESGLHYNRYRYYDPISGRYISKDPIGLRGGFNKNAYSKSNSINFSDPLGLKTLCEALREIASMEDKNQFLNGSFFNPKNLGLEDLVGSDGQKYPGHFVDDRTGYTTDVQYVQVGWNITKSSTSGVADLAMAIYMLGPLREKDWDCFSNESLVS